MFLSAHFLTGISIGVVTGNPYLAAPLGLASHYILDMLPHFEGSSLRQPGDRTEGFKNWVEWLFVILDLAFIVFIIFYFKNHWQIAPVVGGFFAMLPDLLDHIPFLGKRLSKIKFFKFLHDQVHEKFHLLLYPLEALKKSKNLYYLWITLGIIFDLLIFIFNFWYLAR